MAILIGDSPILERIGEAVSIPQFDPNDMTFKPIIVPDDIAELCRAYQAMSGLTFIEFDFIVPAGGKQFALEANPLPSYDSYDRRLGFTSSDTVLRLLNHSAAGVSATSRVPARPHPILLSSWLLARKWP